MTAMRGQREARDGLAAREHGRDGARDRRDANCALGGQQEQEPGRAGGAEAGAQEIGRVQDADPLARMHECEPEAAGREEEGQRKQQEDSREPAELGGVPDQLEPVERQPLRERPTDRHGEREERSEHGERRREPG